jgi:hypothetical protein
MTICPQCSGKKSVYQTNESQLDGNKATVYPIQAAIPCSMCNGTGIMTSFGV